MVIPGLFEYNSEKGPLRKSKFSSALRGVLYAIKSHLFRCQIYWRTSTVVDILNFEILCMLKHVKDVGDYLRHLRHALIYTVFDGMVGKP